MGCPEKCGYRSSVDRGGLEEEWMVHSPPLSLSCLFVLISSCLYFPTPPFLVVISNPLLMQRLTGERSTAEEASAAYRRDVNSSVVVEKIRCSSKRESVPSLLLTFSLPPALCSVLR
ncbi:hypothetical protein CHARACLAT_004178 [Characodon lateralis]|uniref:Uncharacterized protein n=1 Tax=Characodon lateralis TaxID=208331 RepID=A0ABU7F2H4_9TELE|nr:hypothetical protein [Characodon lateralis]